MVRVYFLIEAKQERIHCLLNPEDLVVRRLAGIQPRRSATGQLTGQGLADDPLLFTGGGRTELDLDLLFDVDLSGSSIRSTDVRSLTRPLWQLAENSARVDESARPPLVRFIWGKTWNIPGYVTAVVEHLERFTAEGVPQRSWLRLRFLRASEEDRPGAKARAFPSLAGITLAPGPAGSRAVRTTTLSGGPSTTLNRLRPAPDEDLSVTAAVVLAADIIAESLANSLAGRKISEAAAWVGLRLGQIGSALGDWISGAAHDLADFAQRAAGAIGDQIKKLTGPPPSAIMQKIHAAASAVWGTLGGVLKRLKNAASAAEKKLAALLQPLFQDIADTFKAIYAAAWVVGRAVKARSAQVMSGAFRRMGALADKIRAALDEAGQKSPLLAKIGQGMHSALDSIGSVLEKVKQTGETVLFQQIPAAFGQLAAGIRQLGAAGAHGAARLVRKTVEAMASALRSALSAAEASAAVAKAGTVKLVQGCQARITAAIQHLKPGDASQADAALAAFDELDGQVQLLAADEEAPLPAASLASFQQVRPALELLQPAGADAAALKQAAVAAQAAIGGPLQDLQTALAGLVQSETEQDQAQVKASLAAAEAPSGADVLPDFAPPPRTGDRLDSLAFEYYGDPAFWRLLAAYNNLSDIFHIPAGQALAVPPLSVLEGPQ